MGHPFRDTLRAAAAGTGALVVRNPVIVGGATAFLVTLFYVSANAMWYQPHAHRDAFFSTRGLDDYKAPEIRKRKSLPAETRIRIERPAERPQTHKEAAAPQGDPVVARVQRTLAELQLYSGPVDGLTGPMTAAAVKNYQRIVGLEADGEISRALLDQLDGRRVSAAGQVPVPREAPRGNDVSETHSAVKTGVNESETTASIAVASDDVKRVQAGLRAFGNDQIEIDGVVGEKTSSAIREFQSLFGLSETGDVDPQLVAKMREIGLID